MAKDKLKIMVLATGNATRLTDTIESRGHEYTLAKPRDFDIFISSNVHGYDALYLNGHCCPLKNQNSSLKLL